jgi:predicted metal-dependent hydrolase
MFSKGKKPLRVKEEKIIDLAGRQVPFTLVSSRLARTTHIKISLNKGLEVIVPSRYDPRHLEEFLYAKRDWVLHHLDEMRERKKTQPDFTDGVAIPVFGQPITIRILKNPGSRSHVSESVDELRIFCDGTAATAKKALTNWLKKTAAEYLNQKTYELARIMSVHYNRIAIRSQASRWGSCSAKNNLNFNWKLIFFEPEIVNYVIMHELSHTVHHNHSEKFYAFLEQFCPNYKALRKKLRKEVTPF